MRNNEPLYPVSKPQARHRQQLTRLAFIESVFAHLEKTKNEIEKLAKDPNTPVRDMIVCSILAKAVAYGDYRRLNWILETCFGRMHPEKANDVKDDDDVKSIADLVRKFNLE